MDTWAKGAPADREALFSQTAATKNVSPGIVEKDFWVCWTLHHIFRLEGVPHLMFKGGTSLSKVFGIIKRFSEDIDIVINRHELGFDGASDPANQEGTNLRKRTVERLRTTCADFIAHEFLPKLEAQIRSIIGGNDWTLVLDPTAPDRDTLEFKYPKGIAGSLIPKGISPLIRIELGCRGDQLLSEIGSLTPYAAECFPEQFSIPRTNVNVLSPERTFWEKATILHREYYRAEAGKEISERIFRHYDDLVVMARHERGKSAIKELALLEQVAKHKQHFFREANARYDLAKKGTLRLVPSEKLEEELRKDYERTREMYFGIEPDFEEVMKVLRELEEMINTAAAV